AAAPAPPPRPYSPLGVPEMNHYLDQVVGSVALPVFLYHIPSRTGGVAVDSVRHAMGLENCVGFKDSSGDMNYLNEVLSLRHEIRPEFRVLVGPEELLGASVMMGGDGGVAGGANLFPELFVALFEAAKNADVERVRRLHRVVMSISTSLYRSGRYGSSFVKSVKGALQVMSVCRGHMAAPFEAFNAEDQKRLEALTADAIREVEMALTAS
ncbi:MAG: dihydrodipicolinate synthase family protein, partial [Planctomycetota bacterium]